jgi:hypothetical protein
MSTDMATPGEFSAVGNPSPIGAGGDLPTMPDPTKNDPDGGPHLPTMPDPTNDPERGQELPSDPDPGAKPPARIEDPPPYEDQGERRA